MLFWHVPALLEAGDWMTAADAATAAVDADPYDEASLRVLLRAYVAGGRAAAALAAYAKAREHLVGELGTDPSPETVEVYTAILRGDMDSGHFSVFCFRAGRLIGVESVNQTADHVVARRLLAGDPKLTPEQVADESYDLRAHTRSLSAR